MPIRRALLVILTFTFLVPTLVAGWLLINSALESFSQLETVTMEERVRRFSSSYDEQLEQLRANAKDWGQWDDAYKFIDDPS